MHTGKFLQSPAILPSDRSSLQILQDFSLAPRRSKLKFSLQSEVGLCPYFPISANSNAGNMEGLWQNQRQIQLCGKKKATA